MSLSDNIDVLQHIADNDDLNGADWNHVRPIIRTKLEQNVASFELTGPPPLPPFDPTPSTQGGLRNESLKAKSTSQANNPAHEAQVPLSYMDAEQVKDALQAVLDQLDSFDEGPPFTIQRLCELLLDPKRHYKSVGKYLRAVEKSILVTSTHDSFPVEYSTSAQPSQPPNGTHTTIAFATRSTPSTPLFSPIPFLHEDARLSRSRSRSISPTRLSNDEVREGTHPPKSPTPEPPTPLLLSAELPNKQEEAEGSVGLGMVDELDDPSPGHMSDSPTPLTVAASRGKPFFPSLQDRFVKSDPPVAEKRENDQPPIFKKVKLEEEDGSSGAKDGDNMETDADTVP